MNPIPSNRHESFPLLSIRPARNPICARLRKYSWSGLWGWVEMLSIRVDSIESTWIVRIDWGLWPLLRTRKVHVTFFHRSWLPVGYAGWKCCWLELIQSNQHKLFPLLSIRHAGSRFARRDSVWIDLRRNMRIESNRKVPQTNQLSLGVLDMDGWKNKE